MSQNATAASKKAKSRFSEQVSAYVALTKPRVIELLLITTVPTMILAQRGVPNFWLVVNTLIGGALSAGAANAFNCYLDTDIDKIMGRTKKRPLVTGALTGKQALTFSWSIGILSVLWLGLLTNWLASLISLGALLFYVVIYTMLLKRRTPQNIVWGGAAGAAPVLIGWAAVTGEVSATAWVLFLIIFLWTPPHYWPLSIKYKDDYSRAGVPMLPVVRSLQIVTAQILLYAWAVFACTLLLIPVANMGTVYSLIAILSGAWFVYKSNALYIEAKSGTLKNSMSLFHLSNLYLTAIFIAIAIDPLWHLQFWN